MRKLTAFVAALSFALAGFVIAAAPVAAQSPPLTGERFQAGIPFNTYGAELFCDPTTGTFDFRDAAFQSATGPYPGDFREQGSGTIGTQPGADGQVPVLTLTAQFTVPLDSPTPVNGTKTFLPGLSSGSSSPCNPANNGALLSANNLVYVAQLPDGTVDVGLSNLLVGGGAGIQGPLQETFTSVSALQGLVPATRPGRGLTHKIDQAIAALQQGDLAGMCGALASLSAQVHAQRGKHLTIAEADALIAAAEGIRLAAGC
jgi:hypothetical protein